MIASPDLLPALPEIVLACAGMALLMLGVFLGERSTRLVSILAVLAFVVTAALLLAGPEGRVLAFGGLFVVDGFALFMKLLVLLGSAVALLMSIDFAEREGWARFEYPVLFVFATLGMLLMISANDLISLYLGLELQSLSLYVVAAFQRDSVRSTEAGLKYFVLGALSSGLLLYGISLVYGFAGTTAFDSLATLFIEQQAPIGVTMGIVFVCAGLAFKVAAVPFHMWTPDVYEGAPTPVTAFFAVAPKVAAMALFVRTLTEPFGPLVEQWQQVIVVTSVLSMLLGGFAAIAQRNIKRLMAYSSIGHVGFALLGLAAGTERGVSSVLVYMVIYVAMNVGVFAVILAMRVDGKPVEAVEDLAGLGKTNPMMALAMTILMFSMAGIPPLAGFWGKFYVFWAAVEANLIVVAVIGVLASVPAAYYYIRIIKLMYFDEPAVRLDRPESVVLRGVLTVSAVVVLFFVVFPAAITSAAAAAAKTLFGG